ncbi:MAG: EamA family transporter, partial [Gammaproteobacteria bacterium]
GSAPFIVFAASGAAGALVLHFAATGSVDDLALGTRAWILLVTMTVITNVVPLFMIAESIRRIGAQRAAIVSSIGPPATIAGAVLILGESMAPVQVLGAGLIVVGIVVLEVRRAAVR